MRSKSILVLAIVLAIANIASAEIIRGIDMDFVTIGNAGNPGDTRAEVTPDGKVDSADLAIITSNWLEGTQ